MHCLPIFIQLLTSELLPVMQATCILELLRSAVNMRIVMRGDFQSPLITILMFTRWPPAFQTPVVMYLSFGDALVSPAPHVMYYITCGAGDTRESPQDRFAVYTMTGIDDKEDYTMNQ